MSYSRKNRTPLSLQMASSSGPQPQAVFEPVPAVKIDDLSQWKEPTAVEDTYGGIWL